MLPVICRLDVHTMQPGEGTRERRINVIESHVIQQRLATLEIAANIPLNALRWSPSHQRISTKRLSVNCSNPPIEEIYGRDSLGWGVFRS